MASVNVRVNLPKLSLLNQARAKIEKAYEDEVKNVVREFKITTRTWRTKVNFRVKAGRSLNQTFVTTDSDIYRYVDEGTRPHTIAPRNPNGVLAFNSRGFRPKTAPNRLASRAGRAASPPTVYAKSVRHPGTKARGFSALIAERSERRLKKNIDKILKRL